MKLKTMNLAYVMIITPLAERDSLTAEAREIREITGKYKNPDAQLDEKIPQFISEKSTKPCVDIS